MMNLAIFGQLIILIVFIPILSLTGIEGKMFKPMGMTFSFCLGGSNAVLFYLRSRSFVTIFKTNRRKSKIHFQ